MQDTPTIGELREATGISQSYASMIIGGSRNPSRPLAIHIFRKIGWKHAVLDGLTDEQIDMLEGIEPWQAGSAAA